MNTDLSGQTPDMKFSGVTTYVCMASTSLAVYVLDSRIQYNPSGIPKKEPLMRLVIYLGCVPARDANIVLVLNPKTGLVSPQFHVAFDGDFTTVPHLW